MPNTSQEDAGQNPSRLLRSLVPVLWPAFAFSCVINILVSTSPVFMMQTMDRVLPSSNLSTLAMLTLIAGAAILAMSALEHLRALMLAQAAAWWERDATETLMPGTLGTDHEAARIAGDISRVGGFIGGPSMTALFDAPWVILFFCLIYLLHPFLALLGVCVAVILLVIALIGHFAGRGLQEHAIAARAQSAGVASHLDRNADLLATMGMARNLLGVHRRLHSEMQILTLRALGPDQRRRAIAKFIRALMQVLTLALGAWLVLRGELTGGGMIASSIILARALAPIEQLTGILTGIVETRVALTNLAQVSQAAADRTRQIELPDAQGRVMLEGVTIPSAPGRPPRLHQISVVFEAGETIAVMGSSGSGKSTLAGLLAGAANPTIGAVKIDGFDLRHWPDHQRARMIGYLPQVPTLFPGTIAENIARFEPDFDEAEVVRAATDAGVHRLVSRLPDGYGTAIDFETGPLSGGERQRIALARALYHDPRVLILDEPNAALDREGERALMSSLSILRKRGVTIVMIAHRAGVLGIADKILLLESGRIRDFGPRGEVVNRMNARMMQIDLERDAGEQPRLEDWVISHFKRASDTEARSNAAMVAIEMFNLSLNAASESRSQTPIRFALKHRRGICSISMHDNVAPLSDAKIEAVRSMVDGEVEQPLAMSRDDRSITMLLQLTTGLTQRAVDNGRIMIAEIATPIDDGENGREDGTDSARVHASDGTEPAAVH